MDTTDTTIPTKTQNYLAPKVNEIEDPYNHGPDLPSKKVKTAAKRTIVDSHNSDGGDSNSRHTENLQHPSTHETLKPNNRYSRHNKGPFTIKIDCTCNPPIQVLSLGKILHKNFKDEVTECKKKEPSRTTILFKSGSRVNKIAENLNKINPNLKAHIPNFRVTRLGIIRNVPTDISIEEIEECSVSSAPIVEAKRFEWKDKEGNSIPGTTVLITFDGQTLPQDIKLYFLLLRVDPYVSQPKICYSCYRHGHVKNICKNPMILNVLIVMDPTGLRTNLATNM